MARGGRGNAAKFKADMDAMVTDFFANAVDPAVDKIVLGVRQAAEDNSRRRLGSKPGEPNVADGWFAAPYLPDQGWPPMQGGETESRAMLAKAKPGDSRFVFNSVFYAYFHEKGYYGREGGASAKWMLRDALVAVGDREVRL